jgi:hypothetical protein
MAYTTAADVQKYLNGLKYTDSEGNDNNISESNVDQFIDEQGLVIDLILAKKYTLPISDATDLNYLKLICDKLVVCQIEHLQLMTSRNLCAAATIARRRKKCLTC